MFEALKTEAVTAFDRVIGLRLENVALDGSLHKAPYGGEGTGPNPCDRAKLGWKWSVAVDGHGHSRPNARGMSSAELEAIVIETVWYLIRTYPTHRTGNVAANVLLDLRKHLCRRSTSVTADLFGSQMSWNR